MDFKNKNACENVTKNVTNALSTFGKSRKIDISAPRTLVQNEKLMTKNLTKLRM